MTRKGRKSQSRRGIVVDPKSAPLSFRLTAKSRSAPLCLLYPTRPTPLGSCWVPASLTIHPLKRPSTGGLRPPYWMYPRGLRLPRSTIEVTSGSATTPRHPPTQAAKKLWVGPQLVPVPPAESPVDGAGPQRGRKDGPPDSYLEPLNPHGSPFFFGFQKPFFFQQGKRNGFCRPRKVRTVQNALSGISHSAPLLVLSPRDPLRWARAGTPFLHVV